MARTHSKGKGGGGGHKKGPRAVKRSDAKMVRWNTIEDIPMDEVDEFHAARDKILLDGNGREDYEDEDMDDEVFALKGMPRDSDDDEDDDAYGGEDYGEDAEDDLEDIPVVEEEKKKKSKKSKGKKKKDEDSDKEEESEPEEEGWGRGRAAYYASNADELESDDEEGNELELQEAHRLQAKHRSALKDADFGLDDNPDIVAEIQHDDLLEPEIIVAPSILPTEKEDILRHLAKSNPECLALARDWTDAIQELHETQARIAKLEAEDPDAMSLGMVHIHYQTLLSYCTCVAFYLYLRSSPKYAQRPALLQDHPVMKRLLTLKQSLSTLEALDFAASDDEDEDEDGFSLGGMQLDQNALWKFARQQGLEANELLELLQDAQMSGGMGDEDEEDELAMDEHEPLASTKPPKKKRKTSSSTAEESEEVTPKSKSKSKSKSKTKTKTQQPSTPIFDLVEPEFIPSSSSSKLRSSADASADTFGEASQLDQADAADKTARKKSLRFHTSKIESASARRQGARNQTIGGDDDLPYRDRKKEKNAKLIQEAAKRGNQGGADLDDEEPEMSSAGSKRARESDDDGSDDDDGGDGYYELVKSQNKEKKERKKAEYEEFHGRSRLDEDEESAGPRSLTRAILKNKGLTPHRSKAVRNPRVKKRQKYEKAKKKESSRKAVYKGGLAATGGRYDGEQSGISKVVKSVRLG